jgi:hypothetical protein
VFSRLLKLLPLLIVFGGFSQVLPKFKAVFQYSKIVGTQKEVNALASELSMESMNGPLNFTDENFPEFVKTHLQVMQSKLNTKRTDPSRDFWGSPFRYRPAADGKPAKVTSAGPDMVFDTKDDIAALVKSYE